MAYFVFLVASVGLNHYSVWPKVKTITSCLQLLELSIPCWDIECDNKNCYGPYRITNTKSFQFLSPQESIEGDKIFRTNKIFRTISVHFKLFQHWESPSRRKRTWASEKSKQKFSYFSSYLNCGIMQAYLISVILIFLNY